MKIYVLLLLIGAIVGFAQLPARRAGKASAPLPADPITVLSEI